MARHLGVRRPSAGRLRRAEERRWAREDAVVAHCSEQLPRRNGAYGTALVRVAVGVGERQVDRVQRAWLGLP